MAVLSPCLNVTLPIFCKSLASLTVNLFVLSEATVILLIAVSPIVVVVSTSPTIDNLFPNETSLSSPVFPANLSPFLSTYVFTALSVTNWSFVVSVILDAPIPVAHAFLLSSVKPDKFVPFTFAYSVAIFVVPANDFILDSSRLNLYVVFVLFVVSGVTVIPESLSLVTSTASLTNFCTSVFFNR